MNGNITKVLFAHDFTTHHAGILLSCLADDKLLAMIHELTVKCIGLFFQMDNHVSPVIEKVPGHRRAEQALIPLR